MGCQEQNLFEMQHKFENFYEIFVVDAVYL